jgi:hypothetical protein
VVHNQTIYTVARSEPPRGEYGEVTVVAAAVLYEARLHGGGGLIGPLVLIGLCAAAGGLLLPLVLPVLRMLVNRGRELLRARFGRWRRVGSEIGAERRARAVMGELCPHGWRAELTLYQGRAVTESGDPVRAPVALDWYELRPGGGQPAVVRRVWGSSVVEALEAMVADRRTDVALEQIELRASADGISWPDT